MSLPSPIKEEPEERVTESRDFATELPTGGDASSSAPPTLPGRTPVRAHFAREALNLDTSVGGLARSDTDLGFSPMIRRRATRAATFRTVEDFDNLEQRPGWQPGAEPGVDPSRPDGGHASMPQLSAPSEITVIDFSHREMTTRRLENASIAQFLKERPPAWMKCRWINVNGLSWDVIQALGQHKNLHRLAVEDLMNTRNRTKADWYSTHTYMVLTLQKLVHLDDPPPYDDDDNETGSFHAKKGFLGRIRNLFSKSRHPQPGEVPIKMESGKAAGTGIPPNDHYLRSQPTGFSDLPELNSLRTLQRYHASPNQARTEYMEEHSVLSSRRMAVVAEQVSIFLTNDNTVISFFELSADDVERPILTRLTSPDTILRRSCDASLVVQAIMDAIIDLAIPVTACYSDVIGDLELDVLTRPNLTHTKKLYITITEINKMLSFINPIMTLINALRDHKTDLSQENASRELQNPEKGVIITPMTNIYLGDVLDHCVLITEGFEQIRGQADGMISLIFNTISTYQNESMKQLTIATIIFLPLTFLTGYYGQNFDNFEDLHKGPNFFWIIAAPVVFMVIAIMMRDIIRESFMSLMQKRHILSLRKLRVERERRPRSRQN